ncbi:cobyrinic acid a,c-diamide synthase [Acidihalobacter yilgarnensis]|uniref:Cobyrinic acid a,c-diamide synthase n=1 Tax=Acidihalobacter yilgarnensis TaxID=2819280 RepID=A0A1D8IPT7_9GAMM|nr:MinD/ParA family protein [Acidihalobacter yilgarnensis]AOU98456.1 cobyrinic acid a,c-diamide synthase [Acidihalobacter yilgarnensis]
MLTSGDTVDQADGLRRVRELRPVRVMAVASGKGGVGKTNVSVNLAVALAGRGREVMLMDADLGLANVDVMLGLQPRVNLSHVMSGECTLDEILVSGPRGIHVVPAASGISHMADLSQIEHAGLIRAFSELSLPLDVLIVDTPAGISADVISYTRAAQEVIVVVCDEPASMTDAYALIKVLSREHQIGRFHVLANRVRDEQEGSALYRKMAAVCGRFLDVTLHYLGAVPEDPLLRQAVQRQGAVVELYPGGPAGRAFKNLAAKADNLPRLTGSRGHLEFFVERLVHGPAPADVQWAD